MNNILIVGAHYDDAELGAGGTAARFAAEGKNVYKLTLTDNVTISESLGLNIDYESSRRQSAEACRILGIHEVDFPVIECNELHYTSEHMQALEQIIYDLSIDTIFMHHYNDNNQDHVEAYRLCKTAARHVRNLFTYQSNGYILDQPFRPDFFVDISDYIRQKTDSLAAYQGGHNRQNRLFDISVQRNSVWGYGNHVAYAEGFHTIKHLL